MVIVVVSSALCLVLLGMLIGTGLNTKRQERRSRAQAERQRELNEQARELRDLEQQLRER